MTMRALTAKERIIADLVEARIRIVDAAFSLSPEDRERVFLGTWSIKDLLAHLIGWDLTNLQAAEEILAGRLPGFYDRYDPDWKTYNADLVTRHKKEKFADLLATAKESHHNLIEFLRTIPADEFEKERGLHWHGHRVTLASLLEAEAQDEKTHYAQIEKSEVGPTRKRSDGCSMD